MADDKVFPDKVFPVETIATYQRQAEMLRALGHPVRLRLLAILTEGAANVGDLVEQTGHRQPYISLHLSVLRKAGLVRSTREGMGVWYQLVCPEMGRFLQAIRRTCIQQIVAVGEKWYASQAEKETR